MTPKQELAVIANGIAQEARDNALEEAAALCEVNRQPALAAAIRKRKSSHGERREAASDPKGA